MQQRITRFVLDYNRSKISVEVGREIDSLKHSIENVERDTIQKRNSIESTNNLQSINRFNTNSDLESRRKQQLLNDIEANSNKITQYKEKIKSFVQRITHIEEQEMNKQIEKMNKDGWSLIQIEPVNSAFEYYNGNKHFATFTSEIIMVWQK